MKRETGTVRIEEGAMCLRREGATSVGGRAVLIAETETVLTMAAELIPSPKPNRDPAPLTIEPQAQLMTDTTGNITKNILWYLNPRLIISNMCTS